MCTGLQMYLESNGSRNEASTLQVNTLLGLTRGLPVPAGGPLPERLPSTGYSRG